MPFYPPPDTPQEVLTAVGVQEANPERVYWAAKSEKSRGEAWDKIAPTLEQGWERNPWRKAHTKNYWVWFIPHGRHPTLPRSL